MKHKLAILSILSAIAIFLCACSSRKKVDTKPDSSKEKIHSVIAETKMSESKQSVASPRAVVYRTKKDYINNVPVMMDETKTRLVSYPDPIDVRFNAKPTLLENGYLLDNRGIGVNVAFTSYTYDEYVALASVPSQEDLLSHIIDKEPLVELWVCAPRHTYNDLIKDINQLIKDGFPNCTSLIK